MRKGMGKHWSGTVLMLGVLSLAISPQFIAGREVTFLGIELTAIHNGVLLVSILQAYIVLGVRRILNPVLVGLAGLLVFTQIFATRHPLLSVTQPFESFAALALGPLIFLIDLSESFRRKIPYLLAAIAPFSLLMGLGLDLMNIRELFRVEDLQVYRLQGALIPAHLAMIGVIGVFSSLVSARRNPRWAIAFLANFAIVVWTGTRIPTLVASIGIATYMALELKAILKGRNPGLIRDFGFVAIGISLIGLSYAPIMIRRISASQEVIDNRSVGAPIGEPPAEDETMDPADFNTNRAQYDASNRMRAWAFFFDVAKVDLLFGRGLGASTVANSGEISVVYRVPHNEYLRFLVDGGAIGLVMILTSFLLLFIRLVSLTKRRAAPLLIASFLGLALYAVFDNPISTSHFNVAFWVYLAGHLEFSQN